MTRSERNNLLAILAAIILIIGGIVAAVIFGVKDAEPQLVADEVAVTDGATQTPSAEPAPPADPPSDDFIMRNAMDVQEVAVGWWPGDGRYARPALYAYAHPAPEGFAKAELSPAGARWDSALGEYVLDWDVVAAQADPRAHVVEFCRSAFQHACLVCGWDGALAASAEGDPPPVA